MIRCYITDRRSLPAESLVHAMLRNAAAGVDWIQIREKDMTARELADLVRDFCGADPQPAPASQPGSGGGGLLPKSCKLIVNTRADVALALGAAGVHLPADSPAPKTWRRLAPPGFLIGVSCHTVEEVRTAGSEGADYVLFGPVFAPISKDSALCPRGLAGLAEAARAVRIPVLALGGITEENTQQCIDAGASGIAGISLFQKTFRK